MPMTGADVEELAKTVLWPPLKAERERLAVIAEWVKPKHPNPHVPSTASTEYKALMDRCFTPWARLVLTSVAQGLYVEGYRTAGEEDDAAPWEAWQANGMDRRQIGIHRAALTYGYSYATVVDGTFRGAAMPKIRGLSPRRGIAMYEDTTGDEWPINAMSIDAAKVNGAKGWTVKVYDDEAVYRLHAGPEFDRVSYVEFQEHSAGVTPWVRYVNDDNLDGDIEGEVEPFIPVFGRIDQTTFDRLLVQRFASWVVRTISGMALPESEEEADRVKLKLRIQDFLVAEDTDTKFGSLPASELNGFLTAKENDVRDLAAVSQTPPHHLLGQMANLSAEALAAAEASLNRKVEERQHLFGEAHEQTLGLAADLLPGAPVDASAQVRWRDMTSRSLAQVADALGKLATMLGVPVEMLWEKIPGWTQQDVETAKALAEKGGSMDRLIEQLVGAPGGPPAPPAPPAPVPTA